MSAVHVTDADFEDKVLKANKAVLVDFFAPWCGPCKMAGPVIDKLADDYKDRVVVVKVNVDENQQSAQQFGVMSIPTVIVFQNGKEAERKVGFLGEQGYVEMIEKHL